MGSFDLDHKSLDGYHITYPLPGDASIFKAQDFLDCVLLPLYEADSLAIAYDYMKVMAADVLPVINESQQVLGVIHLAEIEKSGREKNTEGSYKNKKNRLASLWVKDFIDCDVPVVSSQLRFNALLRPFVIDRYKIVIVSDEDLYQGMISPQSILTRWYNNRVDKRARNPSLVSV